MSTSSAHAAETNGGTVTSWLALTESWSPPTQCYSTFLADGDHLVLFNPSLGDTFNQLAWCLPGEITSSYNQPHYGATTTNLGPFLCPNAFMAASQGSSLGAGTTAINCCPSGFTWATIQTSQYCTSSLAAGQTITYAPASSSAISSSTLSAASYVVAYPIYGFDFDIASETSTSTSSSASSSETSTSTLSTSSEAAIVIATGTPTLPTESSILATSTTFSALSSSSSSSSSTTTNPVSVAPPTTSATLKKTLSGNTIAGIVVGATVACFAVIAAFLLILRHHRRAMEEVYSERMTSNELEKRRDSGEGGARGIQDGATEDEMGIGKGKDVMRSSVFGISDMDATPAKLNSYERPEFVGGAEMDATPIWELHGDSKPVELVGSPGSHILKEEDGDEGLQEAEDETRHDDR